jgi:adenosylmethionine-8-amino-7-oxononanoate aminotransferase
MLAPLRDLPHVGDVRQAGFMVGVELVRDRRGPVDYDWTERLGVRTCQRAVDQGLLLRPLGNVVVFMPPLASTETELTDLVDIMTRSIRDITES